MDLENFIQKLPYVSMSDIENNINVKIHLDDELISPLHYACKKNCLEAVEWCVERGANMYLVDDDGYIPIIYTTKLEIMIYLFGISNMSSYTIPTKINEILNGNGDEEDEYEYEEDGDEGEEDEDGEDEEDEDGDEGEEEDEDGEEYEEYDEDDDCVIIHKDNKTTLFLEACRYGNGDLIQFLLSNTVVDLHFSDYFNLTGIHYLCDKYDNFPLLIDILDNYEFDIHIKSIMGETILFEVVKTLCFREQDGLSVDFDILDYLFGKSFNVNEMNILEENILYTSILLEGYKTFSYLLSNTSIDVNTLDNEKMNVLMRSIISDCGNEFIKKLLEHPDIDINHQNIYGDTALGVASDLEMDDFIDILVSAGADTSIINNDGENYYEMYKKNKNDN